MLITTVKIALLDVNYGSSSSGKIVSILHDELVKQGYDVKSFYGRGPKVRKLNVHKISTRLEFIFHVLATRLTGLIDIFSPFSTNKLIKFLDIFKPDLIHLHELHGYYINTYKLLKYLKEKKIPIIWTFHCEYMFTGKCGFAENCNKWKTECNQCPKLREYPSSLFFDFTKLLFYKKKKILTEIDKIHFTAPTKWLADRMLQSIIKNKSISVVPNAVDLNIFKNNKDLISKEDVNISKDSYVVLSVGADLMSDRKGGKWVFNLARKNLDKNIIFLMIGAYNLNIEPPKNVKIISYLKDKTSLAKYYSIADVFLLTSSSESFSMVCAESLACGTPIIGFDSGAPLEIVREDFGKFVKYGDIESLNILLNNIINKKVIFEDSKVCSKFITNAYSEFNMTKKYIEIYKKILKT